MIIGLSGKIGSGKTEVCKILVAKGFTELNFGTKLKESVAFVFDIPIETMYTQRGKETIDPKWGVSPRFLLQRFGTEVVRNTHPNVWVYHLDKAIKENPKKNFVIGDVRFENEFDFVLRIGGEMWRIQRPVENLDLDNHASEILLDNLEHHVYINNNGTLDMLRVEVSYHLPVEGIDARILERVGGNLEPAEPDESKGTKET